MSHDAALETLGLKFNPFPPAATGVAFAGEMWVPDSWLTKIGQCIDQLSTGGGAKATIIVGSYGSGKSYVLQWIIENEFRQRRILPFFFDNPGVAFYDLANQLLRQVGRYELSKALWELLYRSEANTSRQAPLIDLEFPQWLENLGDRTARGREIEYLAQALQDHELTDEEETSFRFAQLVVNTRDRPYYEFRDFIPRSATSLVPEREEVRYFIALIRILRQIFEVDGIAFLIDEFEDVALGKRLAKRQSSEYTATLRRLLDTARDEEFWLALSITPGGLDQTRNIEPALMDRFGASFRIPPLSDCDAYNLVLHRLKSARIEKDREDLWPFEDDVVSVIKPTSISTPRKLIKIFWQSLALAIQRGGNPPISKSLVAEAEKLLTDET